MKVLEHSEAYYREKVEQRLKRVLSLGSSPEYKLTVEELEEWVAESKAKKRIKQRRFMAIAASITLMISALVCVEYFHETNRNTAIAGKNDKQISEESGTVVVKDNEVGVDEHAGADVEIHTTWAGVLEAQKNHPELLVPGYVPEDWEFVELEIERTFNDFKATYLYVMGESNFEIRQIINSGETIVKDDATMIVSTENLQISVRNENGKVSSFVLDDNMVAIIGELSTKNICEIADNIKKGEK